jgi:hypothetical protein
MENGLELLWLRIAVSCEEEALLSDCLFLWRMSVRAMFGQNCSSNSGRRRDDAMDSSVHE